MVHACRLSAISPAVFTVSFLLFVSSPSALVGEEPEFGLVALEGGGDLPVPSALWHALEFFLQATDLLQGLISEGPSRLSQLALVRYPYL
jgi:hypothetical protein